MFGRFCFCLVICTALGACGQGDNGRTGDGFPVAGLDNKLVVLTRNAPTIYYFDRDGRPEGFEFRLTQALGDELGVEVEYKVMDSVEAILQALRAGEGDLAAANLSATDDRSAEFAFSPPYKTIEEEIVCRRRGPAPETPEDLGEVSLLVPAETSYIETLSRLKADGNGVNWNVADEAATEEVIERVIDGEADCLIADSHIVAVNRRYYPELEVAFSLSAERDLVWILPQSSTELADFLDSWIADVMDDGLVDDLEERFFSYIPVFDYVDIRAFKRRIDERFPKYKPMFIEAAGEYDLSPVLLAAQSYQESHWDPRAVSPTGVRGIMMLTQPTARRVGVESRLNAEKNIWGGARYMRDLLDRLPDGIEEGDRYWFALAAYNLGMGHVFDARSLADRLGKDKNDWRAFRQVLPLLGHKTYYQELRYGFARGNEAVRYVRRIRNYHDILAEDWRSEG